MGAIAAFYYRYSHQLKRTFIFSYLFVIKVVSKENVNHKPPMKGRRLLIILFIKTECGEKKDGKRGHALNE